MMVLLPLSPRSAPSMVKATRAGAASAARLRPIRRRLACEIV